MTTPARLEDLQTQITALNAELSAIPSVRFQREQRAMRDRVTHAHAVAKIADTAERNAALLALRDQDRRELWASLGSDAIPLILAAPDTRTRSQWHSEVPSWIVSATLVAMINPGPAMVRVVARPGSATGSEGVPVTGDQIAELRTHALAGGVVPAPFGGGQYYPPSCEYAETFTREAYACLRSIVPGFASGCDVHELSDDEVVAHTVDRWRTSGDADYRAARAAVMRA